MHHRWTSFLQRFSLSPSGQDNATSDTDTNFICLLDHYSLLATQGQDAAKFLQGQASCDMSKVSAQQSQYGSLSTPKGRVYAHFLSSQNSDDSYLLRLPQSIASSSQQQLGKYLAFFKAQQIDCTEQYSLFGLKGPAATANIRNSFGDCPSQALASITTDNCTVIAIDPQQELYECWINNSALADYWPQLNAGLSYADSPLWQLQLIRLGIAELSAATVDEFIAQMLNYQLTGAISFNKGCFTGQEIVARMQYKGKVKRRLYRIECDDSAILNPGLSIINSTNNQAVGSIINSAASAPGKQEALAVLSNDASLEQSLCVQTASTATPIRILDLPYNIN